METVKKTFKSPYHILLWMLIVSAIFCGFIEWGYMTGAITKGHKPAAFGQWKMWLGMIPYCMWLVMTYIATRPAWFVRNYNVDDMYKVHRIVGIVSVVLVVAHWIVFFGDAANKPMAWWAGYISLAALGIAFIFSLMYMTPWFKCNGPALSHKRVVCLHRFNLIAIIAACMHAQLFRIGNFPPFSITFNVVTAILVIYYIYWMFKQK